VIRGFLSAILALVIVLGCGTAVVVIALLTFLPER